LGTGAGVAAAGALRRIRAGAALRLAALCFLAFRAIPLSRSPASQITSAVVGIYLSMTAWKNQFQLFGIVL